MNEIHILDSNTIDQISAGEVVERPSSVVKELVENAIDAGAEHITVEIKDGGTTLIRVTDDGSGIDKSQLKKVFMRHATSKIQTAQDLDTVMSLGFRGEAISSISAVCQVELMTKTAESLTGFRVCVNGGGMDDIEEVGLPNGTTILVRNIFFNTPVRRKFLKTPQTEGSYIADLMQHIALSKPDVAIQFIANGQTKFYTSGNGDIKEIIYRIYGKDVASQVIPVEATENGMKITGYIGKPILNRSNRGYETFFVNGRYIKSAMIAGAVEEGYRTFLMQHKYPFVVLHFTVDPSRIDVNVHPTKMDIRINEPATVLSFIANAVKDAITGKSLVQPMQLNPFEREKGAVQREKELTKSIPQPFEKNRLVKENSGYHAAAKNETTQETKSDIELRTKQEINSEVKPERKIEIKPETDEKRGTSISEKSLANKLLGIAQEGQKNMPAQPKLHTGNVIKQKEMVIIEKPQQMEMFSEEDLKQQEIENFRLVGQVFDTYWIIELSEKIYFVDQHAAHEKVMFERLMQHYRNKEVMSQQLNPPVAIVLTPKEKTVFIEHKEDFEALGFIVDEFGEDAYALRGVPVDLYGCNEKELFISVLDELMILPIKRDAQTVLMKIASMSCKAAVKGNMVISAMEAKELMKELLACDNPYNCPHGRPTIISMTKYEMEKKFKR